MFFRTNSILSFSAGGVLALALAFFSTLDCTESKMSCVHPSTFGISTNWSKEQHQFSCADSGAGQKTWEQKRIEALLNNASLSIWLVSHRKHHRSVCQHPARLHPAQCHSPSVRDPPSSLALKESVMSRSIPPFTKGTRSLHDLVSSQQNELITWHGALGRHDIYQFREEHIKKKHEITQCLPWKCAQENQ